MPTIPRTIKVGPHVYTVVRATAEDKPDILGHADFDAMEIVLRKGLRTTKLKEILLHELLHCCTYPSFTGVYEENEKYTPEDIVNAVAPPLLQMLKDNPKLVEFLTK